MKQFKAQSVSLEQVMASIIELFTSHPGKSDLLEGFKNFIPPKHQSRYEAKISQYIPHQQSTINHDNSNNNNNKHNIVEPEQKPQTTPTTKPHPIDLTRSSSMNNLPGKTNNTNDNQNEIHMDISNDTATKKPTTATRKEKILHPHLLTTPVNTTSKSNDNNNNNNNNNNTTNPSIPSSTIQPKKHTIDLVTGKSVMKKSKVPKLSTTIITNTTTHDKTTISLTDSAENSNNDAPPTHHENDTNTSINNSKKEKKNNNTNTNETTSTTNNATNSTSNSNNNSNGGSIGGIRCPVCLHKPENPMASKCGHIACYQCWVEWLSKSKNECPLCRQKTRLKKLTKLYFF